MTGLRVLYSFPQRLGASRVAYTAWQQVVGLSQQGIEVAAHAGSFARTLPEDVDRQPTLSRGKARLPYRLVGLARACRAHDALVARRLRRDRTGVDLVHTWPLGAELTLQTCREMGIPTVLERPNCHTRFAYQVVADECARLGLHLPSKSEHAFDAARLEREEEEYRLAYRLLCPSDFVAETFTYRGHPESQLLRHTRGYDPSLYYPTTPDPGRPFTAIFVGFAAVRKGLHIALDAWLASPAAKDGRFLIAGGILEAYREYLGPSLAHPSVQVLGHRDDVSELLRESDVLLLPSVEEGFGRVCVEAMASGCIPLVSTVCTDECIHEVNSIVHEVGDTDALTEQINSIYLDIGFRRRLRDGALASAPGLTWDAASHRLVAAYRQTIQSWHASEP